MGSNSILALHEEEILARYFLVHPLNRIQIFFLHLLKIICLIQIDYILINWYLTKITDGKNLSMDGFIIYPEA